MFKDLDTVLIGAVVLIAVVTGLFVFDGPLQARLERFDNKRESDIGALLDHATCLARHNSLDAHRDLKDSTDCVLGTNYSRQDPRTNEVYAIHWETKNQIKICATFETDVEKMRKSQLEWRLQHFTFDGQTGCRYFTIREKTSALGFKPMDQFVVRPITSQRAI